MSTFQLQQQINENRQRLDDLKKIPQLPSSSELNNESSLPTYNPTNQTEESISVEQLIESLPNLSGKLDRGSYVGTAQDLKNEIDLSNSLTGTERYATLAEVNALSTKDANVQYIVDSDDPNNGYYTWDGVSATVDFNRPFLNTESRSTIVSKNIFDKTIVLEDSRLNNATGLPFTSSGWQCVTGVVIPNENEGVYIQGRLGLKNVFSFDENDVLLDPVYGTTNYSQGPANGFYALPEGTKYINFDIKSSGETIDLDTIQVEHSLTATSVVPYETSTQLTQIENTDLPYPIFEVETVIGKNLFNPITYLLGTSMPNVAYPGAGQDILVKDTDSACTRLIPCLPNTDYTVSGRTYAGFAFYNSAGEILPPVQGATYWAGVTNGTYTSPADGVFLRAQLEFGGNGDATAVQIEQGGVATAFEPYTNEEVIKKIDGKQIESPDNENTSRVFNNQLVSFKNETLTIVSSYTDDYNKVTLFTRQLKNNLFCLKSIYLIANTGNVTESDLSSLSLIVLLDGSTTDVVGPYQIDDGFAQSSAPFIGANHGVGNTPTASMIDLKVYADGVQIKDGDSLYDATEVTAITSNEIYSYSGQSQNPTLDDVVFIEHQVYTITPFNVEVNVGLEMAQNLGFVLMYGIQGTPFLSDISNIYLAQSNEPEIQAYQPNTFVTWGDFSTYPEVDRAVFLDANNENCIEHYQDLTVGLGLNRQLDSTDHVFFETASSGKVYFNLISKTEASPFLLNAGDYIFFRGGFNTFKNLATNSDEIAYGRVEKGSTYVYVDIARISTTTRTSIIQIPNLINKDFEVLESSNTITVSAIYGDARGLVVESTGGGFLKIVIK